ncbi:hypothetical protein [Palleronia caenipelagi]|uniref:Uncharacterized protein n=1 Tax=Palleronia caenipelagi TaxID=2489174 RepID=A0A547Q781_9RHOB|nr:hypothetical protein [Palleronia caenipelagi]TRD22213.1 hypothetical protein FEV53_05685 [Palleronia caenipelagi]
MRRSFAILFALLSLKPALAEGPQEAVDIFPNVTVPFQRDHTGCVISKIGDLICPDADMSWPGGWEEDSVLDPWSEISDPVMLPAPGEEAWGDWTSDAGPDASGGGWSFPSGSVGAGRGPASVPDIAPVIVTDPAFDAPEATRIFAGPSDFAPEDYGAYAILSGWGDIRGRQRERYVNICIAFANILMNAQSGFAPVPLKQLVTVWPVNTTMVATDLNTAAAINRSECEKAVDAYDVDAGLNARWDAAAAVPQMNREIGRGPFLFAWNPSADKGQTDRPLFRMDLSPVETVGHAEIYFWIWHAKVVQAPALWIDDWNEPELKERLRIAIEGLAEPVTAALGNLGDLIGLLKKG